jgi:hypothetical protein
VSSTIDMENQLKMSLLRRPYLLGDFHFCLFLFCSHTSSGALGCVGHLICWSFFGCLLLGLGLRVFPLDGLVTMSEGLYCFS